MKKRPAVIGNWKMEVSHKGAVELLRALLHQLEEVPRTSDIVVCPSYPSLHAISDGAQEHKNIEVGAQNVFLEEKGAHTGQVAVGQLKPFVSWCIAGHSEYRAFSNESDDTVIAKAALLLRHGITPIVCIGETQEERNGGGTVDKILRQVAAALDAIDRVSWTKIVMAYEPIWAIGTGVLPTPDDVAEVMLLIRKQVAARHDNELAQRVRIIYGGSVKPDNVAQYIGGPGADGVLVGSASVHPMQFASIVRTVQDTWKETAP